MSKDTPCRECRDNKHGNCDGLSWDLEEDVQAICTCQARNHQPYQPEPEPPTELTITQEQLVRAMCGRAEPCGGHRDSAGNVWARLVKQ